MKKPRSRSLSKPSSRKSALSADSALPSAGKEFNGTSDEYSAIQPLIDLLKQNNLAELELERRGFRIRLRRESASPSMPAHRSEGGLSRAEGSSENLTVSVSGDTTGLVTITSPIVGTFYRSPSPDADPYVEEGDFVKKGQVLCIVEAMKLMNEIESEVDGRVVKILAESTKPVEYGQPLFLIDPAQNP